MNCSQALEIAISNLAEEDVCLFATGLISRRAFAIKDRKANFYILGSMGLISSVGLGVALNTDRKVILFDGDGSLLMDLGTMAMIANYRSKNLFHVVLDNECYESTGAQATVSQEIDFAKIAECIGYAKVFKFRDTEMFKASFKNILTEQGPVFILLKLDLSDSQKKPDRVSVSPEELNLRIKTTL